jgi:dTDP-4-dehydrorhamnose reductase
MVTGANGQLGRALAAAAPVEIELITHDRQALDITNEAAVFAAVQAERPDVIVNAAAYTAVDRAEEEPARAMEVNGHAVETLARAARDAGARLVHISSDFVFDGTRSAPYPPTAVPIPLSVYGRSKLAGEVAAGSEALIIRTSWIYSATGHNFVTTMLRLMAQQRDLRVVNDQIGTPCFAPGLAAAIWQLAAGGVRGVVHYADSGATSWYDFAVAIQEEALAAGYLRQEVRIAPIRTSEYPARAVRPAYSVLETESTWARLGYQAPHWRDQLKTMLRGAGDG